MGGGFSGAFSGSGGYDLSSSSGVGGGDMWSSSGANFGATTVGVGAGSGLSISTPVLVAGLLLAAVVAYGVFK